MSANSEPRNEPEDVDGIPMACPKCGSTAFFQLATATVSRDIEYLQSPTGELLLVQYAWEPVDIIDTGDQNPITCTDCGHTPHEHDLTPAT